MNELIISGRKIGPQYPPFVIAEIGINHGGDYHKAVQMIDAAASAGCECIKFQCHVVEDEMVPNDVIPGNADESIWNIMSRCALTEDEEYRLKQYAESKNMIYLSTPFSRAAAIRLEKLHIPAFKIGSGECNNYPLIEHVAQYGKPVILSTGMNDIKKIKKATRIFKKYKTPFALMHCTSIYPTPYNKIHLGALKDLADTFPSIILGLSDHSRSIYPCLGAVALGASILERHFTSDKTLDGPDIDISMNPEELKSLIKGSLSIHQSLGGQKVIHQEEQATINFAYACVVAIQDIKEGERISDKNIWVKRPGTGEIKAEHYGELLGKTSRTFIKKNEQIKWEWIV